MNNIALIESELGEEFIKTDRDTLSKYSRDETPGNYEFMPEAVFLPEKKEQVIEFLKIANKNKIPVVPRGAGTSRCGGSLPVYGGVVISMEKMNSILDLDEENLLLEVEPGLITINIDNFLKDYGLFYPPDPASVDSCSIGGNVATNAGGPRCLKYGLTRNYVRAIEVIFPDGKVDFLGARMKKNATGYSLLNLITGSEGTLGVITRVFMEVIKKPEYSVTLLIPFKNIEEAAEASFRLISDVLIPSALEFMDEDSVSVTMNNSSDSLPVEYRGTYLIAELDGFSKEELYDKYELVGERCLEYGAQDVFIAEESYQRERIWNFRRGISEALDRVGIVVPEDVVVPRSELSELVHFIKKLENKYGTRIFSFGHIGDGNIHIDILKKDEWENEQEKLVEELLSKVTKLGGKISGEHGIGWTKKKFLHFSRSNNEIELMKKIKKEVDSANIMNPGKIFDIEDNNA